MESVRLQIADTSAVGQARRMASDLARSIGFDAVGVGRAALVVTEAASNLVKHGCGGELLLQRLVLEAGPAIDVLALDRGPGIDDVARATRDGFSTVGTPGTGLGAIRRNSTLADLYTRPGAGMALFARLTSNLAPASLDGLEVGAVNVCHPGEQISGDAFAVAQVAERAQVLVVDGLGHGQGAADAARAAVAVFRAHPDAGPAALLERMHRALAGTRGAAAAVAEIDRGRELLRFAGIGNVAGTIVSGGETRSTVSLHGTVGHDARRFQEFTYPWPREALFVVHTDGVSGRWNLEDSPGLAARQPTLIAGVLYRDFGRSRDDATVVVLRGRR